MWFTIVPFRSLAALRELKIGWNQIATYLESVGTNSFFYFVSRETVHQTQRCMRA